MLKIADNTDFDDANCNGGSGEHTDGAGTQLLPAPVLSILRGKEGGVERNNGCLQNVLRSVD